MGLQPTGVLSSLDSTKETDKLMAHFQIACLVIEAAAQGLTELLWPVICFGVQKPMLFPGSPLFLTAIEGNTFITLDQPFKLSMEPGGFSEQDDGTYVRIAYCLQYKLGGPNGWTI